MILLKRCLPLAAVLLFLGGFQAPAQNTKLIPGIRLRPEVQSIADEIEQKAKKKIYAQYVEYTGEDEFMLGSSFVHTDGTPMIGVGINLRDDAKKVEAVVAHELLHLRLRLNNYPSFLFDRRIKPNAVWRRMSNNQMLMIWQV